MVGIFSGSVLSKSKAPPALVPRCGQCGLYKACNTPKMPVTGRGKRKILVIGEAPGKTEDREGVQFVGESGRLLRRELEKLGVDLDRDCWKTNALICRPPNNETPTGEQIRHCAPNLTKLVKKCQPTTILSLGGPATAAILAPLWRDAGSIGRWAGFVIPSQDYNAWVCPTWHPAYILRTQQATKGHPDPAMLWWRKHLAAAMRPTGRPWSILPDYASEIQVVTDPTVAAGYIKEITKAGGIASFDFETNCLKPETKGSRIYSCSICHMGRRTISYPWHGKAIHATKAFLRSPIKKVGSNIKYEERWTQYMLGTRVRGWLFDTMQGAHLEDNRPEISSLKFQALVKLGHSQYNQHIEGFLRGADKTGLNRIGEIDLQDLLLYGGLDSLLAWKVGMLQMNDNGWGIQGGATYAKKNKGLPEMP